MQYNVHFQPYSNSTAWLTAHRGCCSTARLPAETTVVQYSTTWLPAEAAVVYCSTAQLPAEATVVCYSTTRLPAEAICRGAGATGAEGAAAPVA